MVETHKKEKNTVITKITLTISNGEHIKHTLSTSKHDRYQQHLPKISQNVSGAVRMAIQYGRNTLFATTILRDETMAILTILSLRTLVGNN